MDPNNFNMANLVKQYETWLWNQYETNILSRDDLMRMSPGIFSRAEGVPIETLPPIQGCEPPPPSYSMTVNHVVDEMCLICQSQDPTDRISSACGHRFHPGCLIAWTCEGHKTCPVCRNTL